MELLGENGMCRKLFCTIVVLVAVVMGLLAVFMPAAPQPYVAMIMKFFEVMIPVLAVGALLKYICCCHMSKANCDDKTHCH